MVVVVYDVKAWVHKVLVSVAKPLCIIWIFGIGKNHSGGRSQSCSKKQRELLLALGDSGLAPVFQCIWLLLQVLVRQVLALWLLVHELLERQVLGYPPAGVHERCWCRVEDLLVLCDDGIRVRGVPFATLWTFGVSIEVWAKKSYAF